MPLTFAHCINTQRRAVVNTEPSQTYLDCKRIATERANIEGLDNFQMRHILLALERLNSGGSKVILNGHLRSSRLADEGLNLSEYLQKYYESGSVTGQSEYFALQVFEGAKTSQEIAINFFRILEEYPTSPEIHPLGYLFRFTDKLPRVIDPSVVSTKRIYTPRDNTIEPDFRNRRFWIIIEMMENGVPAD